MNNNFAADFDVLCGELETKWDKSLHRYAELLSGYTTARLTGSRDAKELYDLHIKDCLYSVLLLPEKGDIIDVGSGGGLPGLVWAICRPDLSVTLLDSAGKKCKALETMAWELELKNVKVVWGRCEDHALEKREHYAFSSARAVAHTGILVEYLSPLTALGGSVAAFKGPKAQSEISEIKGHWDRLGLENPSLIPYGPAERSYYFIIWKKKELCSRSYPRKAGTALMKEWWI